MSEWVGKGPAQISNISINPVSQQVAIELGISANPLKSAVGDLSDL